MVSSLLIITLAPLCLALFRKSSPLIPTVDDPEKEEKKKNPTVSANSESSNPFCNINAGIPPMNWRKP